jgi:hypothetical protein
LDDQWLDGRTLSVEVGNRLMAYIIVEEVEKEKLRLIFC